jgi:hypothetical protein
LLMSSLIGDRMTCRGQVSSSQSRLHCNRLAEAQLDVFQLSDAHMIHTPYNAAHTLPP